MKWIESLKKRWNLTSAKEVWTVLLVFALTGFTIMFIKKPLFALIGLQNKESVFDYILYLICILPLYQIFLLLYGALLGKFNFFWEFEKKMFRRMIGKK
jgi:hypothetical protein